MESTTARFRREFLQEAREILEQIADDILKLEADPSDHAGLNAVFRGMHTIKGSAGSFDLMEISAFAHHLETLLNGLREENLILTPEMIDLILAGTDHISAQIEAYETGAAQPSGEDLAAQIEAVSRRGERQSPAADGGRAEPDRASSRNGADANQMIRRLKAAGLPTRVITDLAKGVSEGLRVYAVRLLYTSELMENGYDPAILLNNLYTAARVYHAVARAEGIPPVAEFEPLELYLEPLVYLATDRDVDALLDLSLDPSLLEVTNLAAAVVPEEEMVPGLTRTEAMSEFLIGAAEWLESMERAAITYEQGGDAAALNDIFRSVHNLKGDANFMGFRPLSAFAHAFETLLDRLRSGVMARSADVVDTVLSAIDMVRKTIQCIGRGGAEPDYSAIIARMEAHAAGDGNGRGKGAPPAGKTPFTEIDSDIRNVFLEQLEQFTAILRRHLPEAPDRPLTLHDQTTIRRCLNSLRNASRAIDHQLLERLSDDGLAACEPEEVSAERELPELVTCVSRIVAYVEGIASGPRRLGEILIADGKLSESDLEEVLQRQKPIGEMLQEMGKINREELDDALGRQCLMESAAHVESAVATGRQVRTMRVDESKIESFTNLIGEMLIARNTYAYLIQQLENGEADAVKMLKDNLHLFSRLTNDVQHGVLALRMIPVRNTFQKFQRVVRDISRKQKKFIQLMTDGEEIEIDKKVADILSEPMVHLVRNACDHGIEPPMERKKAGKPEKGTVLLRASREGGHLCIRIIDDGRGINRSKLFEKAQKQGRAFDSPDDPALLDLIFMPGLSTSGEITDISGRGVGMDVVKTTVESLGGTVSVISEEGRGSEIALHMPTSLGIETVLFIEADHQSYGLPIEHVVETLKVGSDRIRRAGARRLFHYRGEVIPVFDLHILLNGGSGGSTVASLPASNADGREVPMVVLSSGAGKYGLIVGRLDKNMEIAVKPVPEAFSDIDTLSGVSIMGDGRVLLVLNPERLVGEGD